ncbi:MAG: hypothetical protein H0Z40_05845 [Desulfotomaculum sp.]|nr:hypothetical protein [Desulfotomaculum sp.]
MKVKEKELNFLPPRIIRLRQKRKRNIYYFITSMVLLILAGGAYLIPSRTIDIYQNKLAYLEQQLNDLDAAKPYYEELTGLKKELQRKQTALREIKNTRHGITGLIKQINSILPRACYVSLLDIKNEELIIEVVTNNPVETAQVQVGLRNLDLFENVSLSAVGEVPFAEGPQPVQFRVKYKGAAEGRRGEEESAKNDQLKNEGPEEQIQRLEGMLNQHVK